MPEYHGQCHCEQTEWKLTVDEPLKSMICHCNACQIQAGSAATVNARLPKSGFKMTKGEDKLTDYIYTGDSGKPVHCYFCTKCSSHVYHFGEISPDFVVVRVPALKEKRDVEVQCEIYGKDQLPWVKNVAHTFDMLPEH